MNSADIIPLEMARNKFSDTSIDVSIKSPEEFFTQNQIDELRESGYELQELVMFMLKYGYDPWSVDSVYLRQIRMKDGATFSYDRFNSPSLEEIPQKFVYIEPFDKDQLEPYYSWNGWDHSPTYAVIHEIAERVIEAM